MVRFGYALSSEEHRSNDLVRHARLAEEAGFEFAMISDHYHPWVDAQGHSPFVWSVLGAIARETERIEVGTGVTCPIIRIHPAIIAQAAATTAEMFEGRFILGIGTGENLNEHILGDGWPRYAIRREMLVEAMDIMRGLWEGELFSHDGAHYDVDNARLYSLPDEPPPIMIAASGHESATLAGELGDGLITVGPNAEVIDEFRRAGGAGKPIYAQATICWATSEDAAKRLLLETWPNAGVPGDLSQELPLPMHFEQAAKLVTAEQLAESIPSGPDLERHVDSLRKFIDGGIDNLYIHQVGPDQEGFLRFWREELQPALAGIGQPAAVGSS